MAKRKKRKGAGKTTKPTQVSTTQPECKPESKPQPVAVPNATTLLDELQQRCESLRHWQSQTNQNMQTRLAVIEKREGELAEIAPQVEQGRAQLDEDQDALKQARMMFDKEQAQAQQTQQAQEAERLRLDRDKAELDEQNQQLQAQRGELDSQWASLSRIRQAQESFAAALDADRARVQALHLGETPLCESKLTHTGDVDDQPGLSLSQAA